MPNPFLPLWEYIPDGEPRVFGERVYIYGSHDRVAEHDFCDFKLKVWSAPVDNLNNWQCHGDSFKTKNSDGSQGDVPWTQRELFAPDVIEKDGKFYLYSYIVGSKGAVGISDTPQGPFKLLSGYKYNCEVGDDGIFNDPGVLADDDGKVYIYYGFTQSNMNRLDPENMYEIIPNSFKRPVIDDSENTPKDERFYEASSIRKINGKYYFIYSPCTGSRLAYAVSDSPEGPFSYKGFIIDNAVDYPGGNNHGSICEINGQWYIFYHRMTNNTIMSRRACVEKIQILPDGSIPTVEMTSLGFEESLNPYNITQGEIACVLKGGCYITEKDIFTRVITNITDGCIIGYKYFDFGCDFTADKMNLFIKSIGTGAKCVVKILIDDYDDGEEIGVCSVGTADGIYKCKVKKVTGRHSLYFKVFHQVEGWTAQYFENKPLFQLEQFVFVK